MISSSCHTKACFDVWINCENLLVNLAQAKQAVSKKITKVIDECALICMGTFHAIKSNSNNVRRMALLCVGICEECADICEGFSDERFTQCARVCRECSESLTQLAFTDLQ